MKACLRSMIYQTYQALEDAKQPLLYAARLYAGPLQGRAEAPWLRKLAAASEIIRRWGLTHRRPAFGIDRIAVGNRQIAIAEEAIRKTPFCTLLHFKKEEPINQPPVLVVSPMSGHFATLLRDTVRTLLPDHDVYITDWHNARDIPLGSGRFALDDFIDHLIDFIAAIGPRCHIVAICQPSVAALAAAAIMAEDDHPAQPRSMTLMAGPIDTRINPTKVNEFATSRPLAWFRTTMIGVVPWRYGGAMRSVYPGFLQLLAFMGMNIDRHLKAFHELYDNLVKGDYEKAEATRKFYDEYFAVMDLPAEFFLETIRAVFQEHDLPRGVLRYRGRRVDPSAIRRTFLLTIEGERDDICAVGQTLAAQELCRGLRPYRKQHHMQIGVGHYGVFSGKRWMTQTYPVVRNVIQVSQ
ncbi:MAG TPA: polyhydroxyalkanoate depolymerase [Stellaceae bacterium]|nr:polyhydroxyalkanoate depolymerase [Stellaceae bacterium]